MKAIKTNKDFIKEVSACLLIVTILAVLGFLLPIKLEMEIDDRTRRILCSVIASVCGTQLGLLFASFSFLAKTIESKKRLVESAILDMCNYHDSIHYTVFDLNTIKNTSNKIVPQSTTQSIQYALDIHKYIVAYREYIRKFGYIPIVLCASVCCLSCLVLLFNNSITNYLLIRSWVFTFLILSFLFTLLTITRYIMKILHVSVIDIEDLK